MNIHHTILSGSDNEHGLIHVVITILYYFFKIINTDRQWFLHDHTSIITYKATRLLQISLVVLNRYQYLSVYPFFAFRASMLLVTVHD